MTKKKILASIKPAFKACPTPTRKCNFYVAIPWILTILLGMYIPFQGYIRGIEDKANKNQLETTVTKARLEINIEDGREKEVDIKELKKEVAVGNTRLSNLENKFDNLSKYVINGFSMMCSAIEKIEKNYGLNLLPLRNFEPDKNMQKTPKITQGANNE